MSHAECSSLKFQLEAHAAELHTAQLGGEELQSSLAEASRQQEGMQAMLASLQEELSLKAPPPPPLCT